MHKRASEAERRIEFDIAKSGNSAGYLPRLFDFQEQLTEEWAQRVYVAHCEAWTQQNRSISAAFIRAVRDQAIAELVSARKLSVRANVALRAQRTGQAPNPTALDEWSRRMDRLSARWNSKLEAEAVAIEYHAAKLVQVPQAVSIVSAVYSSRLERVALESGNADSPRSTFIGTKRASSKRNAGLKPGPALARPADFVSLAGELWRNAMGQNSGGQVSSGQLKKIASSLDKAQYVPPAKYLEERCANEVKAFNSRHSNSKIGPIQTWERLVMFGDKDHLRGMRKLLSRCAKQHPR